MYRNVENSPPCIEMPGELADRWLEALRSGEYSQCGGSLMRSSCTGDSFCCLGVLQMVVDGEVERFNSPNDAPCSVPSLSWLRDHGIRFSTPSLREVPNPEFYVEYDGGHAALIGTTVYVSAAELNDNGLPFNKIADILEPLIKKI